MNCYPMLADIYERMSNLPVEDEELAEIAAALNQAFDRGCNHEAQRIAERSAK